MTGSFLGADERTCPVYAPAKVKTFVAAKQGKH